MDLSIRCDSVHDIILATLALVILLSVGAHQRIQRCEGMSWRICESVRNNWQKNNKNHFLTPWESILEQPWFTQGPENKRESLLLFLYLGEFEAMESTLATVPPSPKTIRFLLDYTPSPPPQLGRAHVWTPVTSAHLVCRLLLEKKKQHNPYTHSSFHPSPSPVFFPHQWL